MVVLALIFSAFFSGIEIAFISANKLHIELQKKQGTFSGKILADFINKPSQFIGTTLIGNTIALVVVYGIFMASLLEPLFASILPEFINNEVSIVIVQTVVATLLVLAVAEFTPRSFFLLNPDWLLSVFAIPMWIIYRVMSPLVFVVIGLSRFLIKSVLRLPYSEAKPVFGRTDLDNYIKNTVSDDSEDTSESGRSSKVELNTRIFYNALEFKTVRVRECMIPRAEISAVDIEDDIETLKEVFIESGHSKIVIYKDSIDEIIGYCHSLQLFKKPREIANILTPIIIVPETMLANELMIQLITEHKSIALVVDEFGGTSGIVTIEDIIEEIFGEIQDEHDDEDWVEQQIDDNTYLVSARHEIDYLNEKYNWSIPEGDYGTLGGYILSVTEDLPQLHDIIDIPPFTIAIVGMQDARIDIVKIKIREISADEP